MNTSPGMAHRTSSNTLGNSAIRRFPANRCFVICWLGLWAICFGKSAGTSAKSLVVSQDSSSPLRPRESAIKTGICTECSPHMASVTVTEPSTCIGDPSADSGCSVVGALTPPVTHYLKPEGQRNRDLLLTCQGWLEPAPFVLLQT